MGVASELAVPVTLATVAPDDEGALRDWFAVPAAAQAHDVPADPRGREAVGVAQLTLPVLDNPDNALGELVVAPRHRRHGVGRRLLQQLTEAARAAGRARPIVEAREPLDEPGPAPAFLTAAGAARPSRTSAGATPAGVARRPPPGHRPGTPGTGRAPNRHGRARPGRTARRIHRHLPDCHGHLVRPPGDTLVEPAHRGRRLRMLVKLANLERVRQHSPELGVIDTHNADSNPWMVSINEAMGHRPYDRLGEWELDL